MKRIIPVYIFQQVNVLLVSNLLDSLIVSEYQMEPNLWEVSHD
ncbi:Tn5253 hypothetical protein [Streptococcus pneumoniae]|nr:Tn5253 hypothetical protein [Streptococcus pneumoniae]